MGSRGTFNRNIVPITFPDHGRSVEKIFQEQLRQALSALGLSEIRSDLITNEFFSFDIMTYPRFSPLRNKRNVVYLETATPMPIDDTLFEEVNLLHKERFACGLARNVAEKAMLLSHTTATVVSALVTLGPSEYFVISKTFRGKPEKREKVQVDCCLCNRTLQEGISFVENLYSLILGKKIRIYLRSDFYYFAEPSFSFEVAFEETDSKYLLGSGGFMREGIVNLLNKMYPHKKVRNILFVGFPYQKLLNLKVGKTIDDWNVDYNSIK